ncbi:MAG: hypothetical protein JXB08_04270 [Bacilli bacterium]|nr:hypothetical protein [Bacilli bacterium]
MIISLVFVGLIAYNYLSGNYAACQADPLCMDEATGFWAWAAFMAFAISAVLAVFAFALNGFLRRFQHANLR